ncbi:MAG: hypothetical protein K2X29_12540 [Candidatus Obscuribacterales bacterium]|nr:hypothetical protein [Candidatus Obscuribacterales bacterium]
MEPLVRHAYKFDLERAKSAVAALQCHTLKEPATIFVANLEYANDILTLPLRQRDNFLTHSIRGPIVDRVFAEYESQGKRPEDHESEVSEAVEKEVQKYMDSQQAQDEVGFRNLAMTIGTILDPETKRAQLRTFGSALSSVWTSFECLNKEAWVAIVNNHPLETWHKISSSEDKQQDRTQRRTIEIGLLAKHRFNIENHLGDLLEERFDFTGVDGITRAYKVLFADEELKKLLSDSELRYLEKVRHLIQHRAGRVDEQFKKQTNTTLSIGDELLFQPLDTLKYGNNAIEIGCNILKRLDELIREWHIDRKTTTTSAR